MFAITKWVGSFMAGVLLTVLFATFTFVRSVGSYESTMQQQQKSLDLQQKMIEQQQKTLDEIKRDVTEIRNKQK
jgi:hypothetical protein